VVSGDQRRVEAAQRLGRPSDAAAPRQGRVLGQARDLGHERVEMGGCRAGRLQHFYQPQGGALARVLVVALIANVEHQHAAAGELLPPRR
jgi:hypothetical protein